MIATLSKEIADLKSEIDAIYEKLSMVTDEYEEKKRIYDEKLAILTE